MITVISRRIFVRQYLATLQQFHTEKDEAYSLGYSSHAIHVIQAKYSDPWSYANKRHIVDL